MITAWNVWFDSFNDKLRSFCYWLDPISLFFLGVMGWWGRRGGGVLKWNTHSGRGRHDNIVAMAFSSSQRTTQIKWTRQRLGGKSPTVERLHNVRKDCRDNVTRVCNIRPATSQTSEMKYRTTSRWYDGRCLSGTSPRNISI